MSSLFLYLDVSYRLPSLFRPSHVFNNKVKIQVMLLKLTFRSPLLKAITTKRQDSSGVLYLLRLLHWTVMPQRQKIFHLPSEMQLSVAGCSRFAEQCEPALNNYPQVLAAFVGYGLIRHLAYLLRRQISTQRQMAVVSFSEQQQLDCAIWQDL